MQTDEIIPLDKFIKENRRKIDFVILRDCPGIDRITDAERENWVLNHKELFKWARENNVGGVF